MLFSLAESNDSLPSGLWSSHRQDKLRARRLLIECRDYFAFSYSAIESDFKFLYVWPEFCSRGARACGTRVRKFVVTKSSSSESHLAFRSARKRIWLKFFATACHSNWWLWRSNFKLTELGRKISTAIVWTAAKCACIFKLQGGTCPSAPRLATPLRLTTKHWRLTRFSAWCGSDDHREDGVGEEGEGDDGWRHGDPGGREFADIQWNADADHRSHRRRNRQVRTTVFFQLVS